MVVEMNFIDAPANEFSDFLARFTGLWGIVLILAMNTTKDKDNFLVPLTILNVFTFIIGPALAQFFPGI